MKLKIGILTQPLLDNYGGLLQAYALKEVLQSMGHEVLVVNRQRRKRSKFRILASTIKSFLVKGYIIPDLKLTQKERKIISNHTLSFREKYIPNLTELITTNKEMLTLNKMGFDAYIVGSDQCWRPRYSPAIQNYFLDFAENDKKVKRVAYAASFGVSDWEFNEEDSKRCSELAKKFDAISVREDSGIDLAKNYLGMDALHVLDPTMLLAKEHYIQIANNEKQTESDGNLKVYVLDKTKEKQELVDLVENKLGLKQFEVLPQKRINKDKFENINDFIYPNPAEWLRGYQDAKFVVTDSFHGTAFSILFNIPFIAIGNEGRGLARFESLLRMFGLKDRLVTNTGSFDMETLIQIEIDWDVVNSILDNEKEKAKNYLKTNLSFESN